MWMDFNFQPAYWVVAKLFLYFVLLPDMRKGTQTFLRTYPHASVWRKEITLSLGSAGQISNQKGFPYYLSTWICFLQIRRLLIIVWLYYFVATLYLPSDLCQRRWGSMSWKWYLLDLLVVVGRRLLQLFEVHLHTWWNTEFRNAVVRISRFCELITCEFWTTKMLVVFMNHLRSSHLVDPCLELVCGCLMSWGLLMVLWTTLKQLYVDFYFIFV